MARKVYYQNIDLLAILDDGCFKEIYFSGTLLAALSNKLISPKQKYTATFLTELIDSEGVILFDEVAIIMPKPMLMSHVVNGLKEQWIGVIRYYKEDICPRITEYKVRSAICKVQCLSK